MLNWSCFSFSSHLPTGSWPFKPGCYRLIRCISWLINAFLQNQYVISYWRLLCFLFQLVYCKLNCVVVVMCIPHTANGYISESRKTLCLQIITLNELWQSSYSEVSDGFRRCSEEVWERSSRRIMFALNAQSPRSQLHCAVRQKPHFPWLPPASRAFLNSASLSEVTVWILGAPCFHNLSYHVCVFIPEPESLFVYSLKQCGSCEVSQTTAHGFGETKTAT